MNQLEAHIIGERRQMNNLEVANIPLARTRWRKRKIISLEMERLNQYSDQNWEPIYGAEAVHLVIVEPDDIHGHTKKVCGTIRRLTKNQRRTKLLRNNH